MRGCVQKGIVDSLERTTHIESARFFIAHIYPNASQNSNALRETLKTKGLSPAARTAAETDLTTEPSKHSCESTVGSGVFT